MSEHMPLDDALRDVDVTTPAVVLKLDHNVMHHGGLGVIRSLGRLGVPVYGVHEGRWAPAAHSRYLHGRYFWQPKPGDTFRLLTGLKRLAELIGRPAVLIPTDDAGSIFLAEHAGSLSEQFLFPRPPRDLPRRVAGKYSLFELCGKLGLPCPLTELPGSLDAAMEFAARCGFPLIAKLTTPWTTSGPGAVRSTTIISDQGGLADIYTACSHAGAELMLQEFIPGGAGHDWFFHGYCDATSTCRPAFTGVKERSYPAHAGLTCLGRAADNARLRDQVVRMLAALSYRGIVDLDLRLDARDDQFKLLDFNPRIGAQFRLFRDCSGVDVAIAQYLDLTGQPVPESEQVDGRTFLVENYDPIAAFSYWRSAELGFRAWVASWRAVDETAWLATDDLRPFGLMCLRMAWRMASRPLSRGRPAHSSADPRYRSGPAAGRQKGAEGRMHTTKAAVADRDAAPPHTDEEATRV
jgi:D-aspartate ligase